MNKLWPLTLLVIVYFILRLPNLLTIPMFTDEAIYLRWAQIISRDFHYLYLPLTDGKPPLFIWITAAFMRALPSLDPLLTGRLVSVLAGLVSLLGVLYSSQIIFKDRRVTLFSALFYLFSAFTFFYDRFALTDSLLAAFGIWSLGLSFALAEKIPWPKIFAVGLTIGLGLLTKTQALFFLAIFPLSWLVLRFPKNLAPRLLLSPTLAFLAILVISQGIFSLLRFFPEFYIINLKSYQFIVPLDQFLFSPLQYFWGNLTSLVIWQIEYLTYPVAAIVLFGLIAGVLRRQRSVILLFLIYFSYLLAMILFNKVIYARYLLMYTPPLLLIAAWSLSQIFFRVRKPLFQMLAVIFVFSPSIYTIFFLFTNPPLAPIPDNDSSQYLNSWSSGNGLAQTVNYLARISRTNQKVIIGVEGTFGLLPYGLELYSDRYSNLEIKAYWPPPDKLPDELVTASKSNPVFYIIYQRNVHPGTMPLELVSAYRQGTGPDFFQLYKVKY